MKTDFLVLPFYDSIRKTSLYDRAFYNSAPNVNFRVFCPYNELLPFVAPLVGSSCDFTLYVKDFYNETVAQISSKQMKHKVVKKGSEKFILFSGGVVNCLDLGSCKLPYYIQIGEYFSEWFWVGDTQDMVKFELTNSQDFLTVPYSLEFKQYFWLNTTLGTSEIDTFKVSTRDERGNTRTKFTKMTENFNFYFFGVPAHMKQVFSSFEALEGVKIISKEQTVVSLEKQAVVKPKRADSNFSVYELELTVPSDTVNELSYCETPLYSYDVACVGTITPLLGECAEIGAISGVEVDCETENELDGVDVCCFDEIDFFATVTYE